MAMRNLATRKNGRVGRQKEVGKEEGRGERRMERGRKRNRGKGRD